MTWNTTRSIAAGALVLGLAGACATASRTLRLPASEELPAAQGTLEVTKRGPNTQLEVKVEHLAPPTHVEAGTNAWVLWAEPVDGGPPQNLGVLPHSKDLSSRLTTLTPLQRFRVFFTPEPSGQVLEPSGPRMLETTVERG